MNTNELLLYIQNKPEPHVLRVFDYGNDILNEIVTVTMVDPIDNEVIYETDDGEEWVFSGMGYFTTFK